MIFLQLLLALTVDKLLLLKLLLPVVCFHKKSHLLVCFINDREYCEKVILSEIKREAENSSDVRSKLPMNLQNSLKNWKSGSIAAESAEKFRIKKKSLSAYRIFTEKVLMLFVINQCQISPVQKFYILKFSRAQSNLTHRKKTAKNFNPLRTRRWNPCGRQKFIPIVKHT